MLPPPKFSRLCQLLAAAICCGGTARAATPSPVDSVDPFIGTLGDGNIFLGATVPFGFIQVGPDTGPGSGASGYKFSKNINGFSQQHISGVGAPVMGEISVFPLTGPLEKPSAVTSTGKSSEEASPGYYSVTLAPWNVKVELTATRHVALHRHTFPAGDESHVLVDVGHCLYGTGGGWNGASPTGGEVHVDPAAREVSGFMVYKGGRTTTRPWKVYFAARFDTPFGSFGTWDDAGAVTDGLAGRTGAFIGAALNFKTTAGQVIQSKVGISWRSVEQARAHLAAEAPGWDFELAHRNARAAWADALDKIQVEGGTPDQRKLFYTSLYHTHLTPNDWTGESPERYGDRTYYENMLCVWDTFRTVNPLLTLIQPTVQTGIVNSLIHFYEVDGWTGDAHSAHQYEHVQNGSNADVVIADAYVKNLPGIDWTRAYQAVRKNAFVDADPAATGRPQKGRFRLTDYRARHYLPTDVLASSNAKNPTAAQAVSRTLEYVYDDFCIVPLARKFGTPADAADLEGRALWYAGLWDRESGFMRGRNSDGSWYAPFDPLYNKTGPQYYEGHAWTWSWYVPHDAQGLVNLLGGSDAFVDKLTMACDRYYEAYNEPCMLETFFFIHAGRPDKTQHFVRKALANFTVAKNGIPGNDDSGTTSGWLVWAMLGIYPNAGQDYYYIGSPTFTKATVQLPGGKKFVIKADAATAANEYVAAARLNGKPWNQSWLRHADLIGGAELDLTMQAGTAPWGSQVPPPSYSKPGPAPKTQAGTR